MSDQNVQENSRMQDNSSQAQLFQGTQTSSFQNNTIVNVMGNLYNNNSSEGDKKPKEPSNPYSCFSEDEMKEKIVRPLGMGFRKVLHC